MSVCDSVGVEPNLLTRVSEVVVSFVGPLGGLLACPGCWITDLPWFQK